MHQGFLAAHDEGIGGVGSLHDEINGGATTETTSVPLRMLLPTAPCRCLLAPHHCGDPDRFQAIGLTFEGSLNQSESTQYGLENAFCQRRRFCLIRRTRPPRNLMLNRQ